MTKSTTIENFKYIGDINPANFKVIGYGCYQGEGEQTEIDIDFHTGEKPNDDIYWEMVGLVENGRNTCNHCNHGVKYLVFVKSNENTYHIFGSECANGIKDFSNGKFDVMKEKSLKKTKALKKSNEIQIFLDNNKGLKEALALENNKILSDMNTSLKKYASLSEKQVAFALKLAIQEADKAKVVATKLKSDSVQVPTDRIKKMEMTVVSAKEYIEQNHYSGGEDWKTHFLLESPEGWKVWGKITCGQGWCENFPTGIKVIFSGTCTQKKGDPFFGYFKRGIITL